MINKRNIKGARKWYSHAQRKSRTSLTHHPLGTYTYTPKTLLLEQSYELNNHICYITKELSNLILI